MISVLSSKTLGEQLGNTWLQDKTNPSLFTVFKALAYFSAWVLVIILVIWLVKILIRNWC